MTKMQDNYHYQKAWKFCVQKILYRRSEVQLQAHTVIIKYILVQLSVS